MARKKPIGTKAEDIRKYVRAHPDDTRKEFIIATNIQVGNSQFYTIRKQTLAEMKKEAKAKPTKTQMSWAALPGETPITQAELHQLREDAKKLDEYRYRCWKLEGEKFGYVERLKNE